MYRTALGRRTRRSSHRIRVTVGAAAAAGMFLATTGCSSGDGGPGKAAGGVRVVEKGKLTACTHLPYPPFQFERDGRVVGFDVALIDLVAQNLKVEQKILDTPFETFKTGAFLNSDQCDLAAAGMTITDERKKNVDFSVPYFDATQALLATRKSGVTSLAEVKAKTRKLGAQAGTTGETYAKAQGFDPVAFESSDAVLNGLRTGQVDAVVIDYPVVQGWLGDAANAVELVLGQNIETGEKYGFPVKKGNAALLSEIDKVIAAAKADGTYKKLYERWIGPLPQAAS